MFEKINQIFPLVFLLLVFAVFALSPTTQTALALCVAVGLLAISMIVNRYPLNKKDLEEMSETRFNIRQLMDGYTLSTSKLNELDKVSSRNEEQLKLLAKTVESLSAAVNIKNLGR